MSFTADRKERLASLAGVGLLHLLFGWALLLSLAPGLVRGANESMDVFNVRPPRLPPPARELPQAQAPAPAEPERDAAPAAPEPAGAAAPPSSASLSPKPARDIPPPVLSGIVPGSGGETAPLSGGPDWMGTGGGGSGAGSGSGSGTGTGTGTGSGTGIGRGGTGGRGSGGSEPVARAKLRGGKIGPADYPRAAGGAQGTVEARLTVSAAGAVTGCRVTRSSGNRVLDETTCRLIRERFRFVPARDAQGRAVADIQGWQQRWWRD